MQEIVLDWAEVGQSRLELVRSGREIICRIGRLGEVHVLSRCRETAQGRQNFLRHCANWTAAYERACRREETGW